MTGQFAYAALSRLRHRLQRALDDRRSRAELHACPPSELMPRRLEQLGLDPAYLKHARGAIYRDLERVCASCKAWRRCAHDLANGNVQTGMGSYCLNAPTIDALTVDRPARH